MDQNPDLDQNLANFVALAFQTDQIETAAEELETPALAAEQNLADFA